MPTELPGFGNETPDVAVDSDPAGGSIREMGGDEQHATLGRRRQHPPPVHPREIGVDVADLGPGRFGALDGMVEDVTGEERSLVVQEGANIKVMSKKARQKQNVDFHI